MTERLDPDVSTVVNPLNDGPVGHGIKSHDLLRRKTTNPGDRGDRTRGTSSTFVVRSPSGHLARLGPESLDDVSAREFMGHVEALSGAGETSRSCPERLRSWLRDALAVLWKSTLSRLTSG